VAGALTSDDLRRLARLGAMRRIEEIRREEAAIRSAFPELFDDARPEARRRPGRPPRAAAQPAAEAPKSDAPAARGRKARKRRKPTMSAAQKKAVSERMKKYWAERRKAKG
jgi:hypothetical protein